MVSERFSFESHPTGRCKEEEEGKKMKMDKKKGCFTSLALVPVLERGRNGIKK